MKLLSCDFCIYLRANQLSLFLYTLVRLHILFIILIILNEIVSNLKRQKIDKLVIA